MPFAIGLGNWLNVILKQPEAELGGFYTEHGACVLLELSS